MQKLPTVFVWGGVLFLIVSVICGWILGPFVIRDQIVRMAQLRNNTFIWDKWTNPTNEMFLRVYFFNVTNPSDVEAGGIPIFRQAGPFTYEETRFKENLAYHEQNDTISYTQPVTYHFRLDLSSGSDKDLLTVLNIPLVGISARLHTYSSFIRYMVGTFLTQYEEPLFVSKTVKEMLFDGYYNEMVDELQHLTGENFFPDALVGVLVGRNNSHEGLYEVYSGIKDSTRLGEIASFNGHRHLSAWPREPCNMINGSDGSVLPPLLTKDSVLRGFHHDVCRSFYITFTGEVEYEGVAGYRFEPPEAQYLGPKKNPDNACFCLEPKEDFSNCFEDGVYSGAGCHRDGPITISNPHFMYAPFYLNKTKGLMPDKEKHGLFVDLEPSSGLILRAARRMQINVDLKPNRAVDGMHNVPSMQFPILWVEETFVLDKEVHSSLLYYLVLAETTLQFGKWVCLAASLALLVVAITIYVARARNKSYIYN
ncbi:lysosome membrane protein 2 [Folsomia candida]|uniref:Lysosome membrane protein 2 n=1 Tax=Folsomia candida TaxID=158441 RepID=A0A226DFN3_FOLCA|nr:lysosome membrane protein 2 [Folsomia candida]OXA43788.1 Lysosome membrane protein 2 [Folsomia candida]